MSKSLNELEMLTIQVMRSNISKEEKNLKENFAFYGFDDEAIVEQLIGDSDTFFRPMVNQLNNHLGKGNNETAHDLIDLFVKENKSTLDGIIGTMKRSHNPMSDDLYQVYENNPYSRDNVGYTLYQAMRYTASKTIFTMCKDSDMDGLYKIKSPFNMKTGAAKSFDEGQYVEINAGQKGITTLLNKIEALGKEIDNEWNRKPKAKVLEKEKAKCDNSKNMGLSK